MAGISKDRMHQSVQKNLSDAALLAEGEKLLYPGSQIQNLISGSRVGTWDHESRVAKGFSRLNVVTPGCNPSRYSDTSRSVAMDLALTKSVNSGSLICLCDRQGRCRQSICTQLPFGERRTVRRGRFVTAAEFISAESAVSSLASIASSSVAYGGYRLRSAQIYSRVRFVL